MSAVALSILATSCSNDEPAFPTEPGEIYFTAPAEIASASSRVSYVQDGDTKLKVRWEEGDVIELNDNKGVKLAEFYVDRLDNTNAYFKCKKVYDGADLKDVTGKLIYQTSVAGYVQKENGVASGGTKGVSHLQGANVIEASFKNQNFTSGNLEFKFKNTTAIIRIIVTPKYDINPGATITVSGSSTWASSGNNTLTLEDFNVKAGKTLVAYIAVPQATVARYLMVKIKNSKALLSLNYLGFTNNTTYYQGREYTANLDGDKIYYYVSYGVDNHEYVDLGTGALWATMNIGAEDIVGSDSFGKYFQWGSHDAVNFASPSSYKTTTTLSTLDELINKESSELLIGDDAAAIAWGNNWRIPTHSQCCQLINNSDLTWVWNADVNCYIVTSKQPGGVLFLPAAGYYEGIDKKIDNVADYWSSNIIGVGTNASNVYCLQISNVSSPQSDIKKEEVPHSSTYSLPIRPVYVGPTSSN